MDALCVPMPRKDALELGSTSGERNGGNGTANASEM